MKKKVKEFFKHFGIYDIDDFFDACPIIGTAILGFGLIFAAIEALTGTHFEFIQRFLMIAFFITIAITVVWKVMCIIALFLNEKKTEKERVTKLEMYYIKTKEDFEKLESEHESTLREQKLLFEQIERLESQLKEYEGKQKD